jgi:phosphate-selective porin
VAPAAAQSQDTKVDASRGGITISSGVNSMTINARVQLRWTLDDREASDSDTDGTGEDREDGPLSQFDVPRLRLLLSGGAFKPWLRYSFQFELSRSGGEGDSKIKDAALEIRPTDRNYRISFGQFKVPFGLQELTSSMRQQFVDRAITDSKFNPARDMGVMLSGSLLDRRVGYDVGLFNGSGESIRQNNQGHLWAARAFYDPWGPYTVSEGSIDAGERPVLHLGVGVHGGKQIRGRSTAGAIEDPDNQTAFNLEFAYKAPRFYSTAEYFWMTDQQENPAPGPDIESNGFHVQASYMVLPRTTEVGIRYARIAGDTNVDDAESTELRGVVSYFWQAHNLKLQADAGTIGFGANFAQLSSRARQGLPALGSRLVSGTDLSDTQVRVQLQLAF